MIRRSMSCAKKITHETVGIVHKYGMATNTCALPSSAWPLSRLEDRHNMDPLDLFCSQLKVEDIDVH